MQGHISYFCEVKRVERKECVDENLSMIMNIPHLLGILCVVKRFFFREPICSLFFRARPIFVKISIFFSGAQI